MAERGVIIPLIQDSARLDTGVGRERFQSRPEAHGGLEAAALGGVSDRLSETAKVVQKLEDRFDEANANEREATFTAFLNEQEAQFLSLRGRDPQDKRGEYLTALDRQIDTLARSARNDRARDLFLENARYRRTAAAGRAAQHVLTQFSEYEMTLSRARIANATTTAGIHFQDDQEILRQQSIIDFEVQAIGRRGGLAPEVTEEARIDARGGLAYSVLALRGQRNPSAILAQLRSSDPPELVLDLTPQRRVQLESALESEMRQRAAAYRSQVNDRMRAAVQLLEMGEQPINPPSVAEVRAALGEDSAAAYGIQWETFSAGSRLNGLSNGQLQALAMAPPSSAGNETQRYQTAIERRAAANILQLRNADPMAYAVRAGRVANPAEVQTALESGDMQALGRALMSRVGAAMEQQRELGTAPAPLTRQEAAGMRSLLDRLPSEQRALALTTLREQSALGPSVYNAFVAQIYGDNPGAMAGAGALMRRRALVTGGEIDGQTVGRRMLSGAALLNPQPVEYDEQGKPVRQRPSVDLPSEAALRGVFNAHVGDAYAGDQRGYERAFEAFRSYYVGATVERGIAPSALSVVSNGAGGGSPVGDPGAVRVALEAAQVAVGQMRENRHGGVAGLPNRTYLPYGMDERMFMASLREGWPDIQARYAGAGLTANPDDYDYARDANGFYTVFYRGVPVPNGEGGFVRVRPRLAGQ